MQPAPPPGPPDIEEQRDADRPVGRLRRRAGAGLHLRSRQLAERRRHPPAHPRGRTDVRSGRIGRLCVETRGGRPRLPERHTRFDKCVWGKAAPAAKNGRRSEELVVTSAHPAGRMPSWKRNWRSPMKNPDKPTKARHHHRDKPRRQARNALDNWKLARGAWARAGTLRFVRGAMPRARVAVLTGAGGAFCADRSQGAGRRHRLFPWAGSRRRAAARAARRTGHRRDRRPRLRRRPRRGIVLRHPP